VNSKELPIDGPDAFYSAEKLRARLSISTLVFRQYQPVALAALEELATCGIRKIELLESPGQFDMCNADSMKLLGAVCSSCGIEVVAYHAHLTHFSDIDSESKRQERVDVCRRQIDTMLELGGNVWGSHARQSDETVKQSYQELAQHVEGTGAYIAIENFGGELSVEARMCFLDEINHPQVGLILDTGHDCDPNGVNPMCAAGRTTEVISLCHERLCHIHMHGFKDGRDHFPPFVDGDGIQWVELFEALYATGYSGHMNFEPAGKPAHQTSTQAVGSVPERIVEMAAQKQ